MDYGDAAALEAEAAGISPSGSSVATHGRASMILWAAPPHFFRTETAIVLYVGESPTVIEALTSVLARAVNRSRLINSLAPCSGSRQRWRQAISRRVIVPASRERAILGTGNHMNMSESSQSLYLVH